MYTTSMWYRRLYDKVINIIKDIDEFLKKKRLDIKTILKDALKLWNGDLEEYEKYKVMHKFSMLSENINKKIIDEKIYDEIIKYLTNGKVSIVKIEMRDWSGGGYEELPGRDRDIIIYVRGRKIDGLEGIIEDNINKLIISALVNYIDPIISSNDSEIKRIYELIKRYLAIAEIHIKYLE